MAWEIRKNGHRYYYRSVRQYGRVKKEYYGCGHDALAAERIFAAHKEVQKRLQILRRLLHKDARAASAKLNRLLRVPFPRLVELLTSTTWNQPKSVANGMGDLVLGSHSPQELMRWGRRAIHRQLMLVAMDSPDHFEQVKTTVNEQLTAILANHIHPVVQLYSERYLLCCLLGINSDQTNSGHFKRAKGSRRGDSASVNTKLMQAKSTLEKAVHQFHGLPLPDVPRDPRSTLISGDPKINDFLKQCETEIDITNLIWPFYIHSSKTNAEPSGRSKMSENAQKTETSTDNEPKEAASKSIRTPENAMVGEEWTAQEKPQDDQLELGGWFPEAYTSPTQAKLNIEELRCHLEFSSRINESSSRENSSCRMTTI